MAPPVDAAAAADGPLLLPLPFAPASAAAAPPRGRLAALRVLLAEPAVAAEMAALATLAWQTGLGVMARQLVPVVDAAVLGRLGTRFLAASSVANIFVVATNGFVWQAIGSALNTLAAQADGAGEPLLVGLWTQTAAAVAAAACALVSALWAFGAAASLALLGFAPETTQLAQVFCRWLLIYMWANMFYIVTTNYLNSFSVSWPPLVANVALFFVNVLLNVALVLGTAPFGAPGAWPGLGFIGSPIASGATQVAVAVLLVVFIRRSPALYAGRWPGWRPREALAAGRVGAFMRQAGPSFAVFLLQDGYLQVCSLLAAQLGAADIAAHSAFLQLLFALTCLIFGLSKAMQVRVALLLGRGDARLARLVAALATALCTGLSVAIGLALVAARSVAGRLFSEDAAVVAAARDIALPCGLGYMLISFFYCSRAILAAQGRPGPAAVAFLVGAWGVGVPFAFAQRRWLPALGVAGIWWGLVLGFACVTLIAGAFVVTSKWDDLARRAGERARGAAIESEGESKGEGDGVGDGDGEGDGEKDKAVALLGSLQRGED